MSYTSQASKVDESQHIYERPKVCDDFQESNEIENCENFLIKDGRRAAVGLVVGAIISIPIWISIFSFVIWVIP